MPRLLNREGFSEWKVLKDKLEQDLESDDSYSVFVSNVFKGLKQRTRNSRKCISTEFRKTLVKSIFQFLVIGVEYKIYLLRVLAILIALDIIHSVAIIRRFF